MDPDDRLIEKSSPMFRPAANNGELIAERISLMREFVTSCAAAFSIK